MVTRAGTLTETTSTQKEGFALNHRLLGTLGMITSPFMLLSFVAAGLDPMGGNRLSAFLGLVFAVGWFSNVAGMWQLRATGDRLAGRIVLGLAMVGITIASLQQVFDTVVPGNTSTLYMITDIAWPLSMLTLFLPIGIGTIVARRFVGWTRFLPFLCGLWLPLSIVAMNAIAPGVGQAYGGTHIMITWFLLGFVVRNGGRASAEG